jgi:ABC-type transporter Mla subunit MlaD
MDALTQRVDALAGQVGALIDTVGGVVSEQADTAELLGRFVALATAVFERIEARLDRIEERLG